MKYYRMIDSDGPGLVCDEFELYGFDPKRLKRGEFIHNWDDRITLLFDTGEPEDVLANTLYWPVFSARIRVMLEKLGVTDLQLLPVRVKHKFSGQFLSGYVAANILCSVPALDLDKSTYTSSIVRDVPVITGVRKYVLKGDALQGHDFIRLAEVRTVVIVSERIKKLFEDNNATGCVFREVDIV